MTAKNNLKALEFIIIVTIAIIGFVFYKNYKNNFNDYFRNASIVFFLISFLPVLYLHNEYYNNNKGTELEIDIYEKKLVYTNKAGITERYNFTDLDRIVFYMAPSWHQRSNFKLLPFEPYHYARIHTKSGKEIIFTCLMASDVQSALESIKGVPIEKKRRLFASIGLDNNWKIND